MIGLNAVFLKGRQVEEFKQEEPVSLKTVHNLFLWPMLNGTEGQSYCVVPLWYVTTRYASYQGSLSPIMDIPAMQVPLLLLPTCRRYWSSFLTSIHPTNLVCQDAYLSCEIPDSHLLSFYSTLQ